MRQKKEREFVKQMEKENASSNETPMTFSSDNLCRRKPVIRRQVPTTISTVPLSTCSLSKTITDVSSILSNTTATTPTNNTDLTVFLNNVSESKRPISVDYNIAKVLPLKVVPQKRLKSDPTSVPAVTTQAESLENKDFYSKLRSFSSRRTSASSHIVKDSEKYQPGMKLRKRSVTYVESLPIFSNHVSTQKVTPYSFDTSAHSATSNEKVEYHGSSRKDIQEAL